MAINRDVSWGFAGEREFTDHLEQFSKPILSIQAGLGFGSYAEDNLNLFTNSEISRYIQSDFGHGDIIVSNDFVETICVPIMDWINENIRPNWQ
jgi:hypothetical protein